VVLMKESMNENFNVNLRKDAYIKFKGPVDFKSRISEHPGEIMSIAKLDVVTIPLTTTILDAVKTMVGHGFRRLPVTDPGSRRLVGIITSRDTVDFLGGGERSLIIENKFKGNLLQALNSSVRELVTEDVYTVNYKSSLEEALQVMLEHNIGGLPVLDGDRRVQGIVSERDFVWLIAGVKTGRSVEEYMTGDVVTATPGDTLGETTRLMIKNGIRRIPLLQEGVLVGIITSFDIMRFIGDGEVFDRLVTGSASEIFSLRVGSLVDRSVVTVQPGVDLGEAAWRMQEEKIGCLPVVEGDILKGIITERDIIRALVG